MTKKRYFRMIPVGLMTITVLLVLSVLVLSAADTIALASAPGIVYVDAGTCPSTGSGTQADPYCSIQDGVDAVTGGGEVRVARGIYKGTQTITAANGYDYTQVVMVEKSLLLRGGYDPANWAAPPDPAANPTVIDAERAGRGISVVGNGTQSVTIDGFTITKGDYSGLGNPPGVSGQVCGGTGVDCGGGLFVHRAEIDLLNARVADNIATQPSTNKSSGGGGIYLWNILQDSTIVNTTVISNTAIGGSGYGGGLEVYFGSSIAITNTNFIDNHASQDGGGAYIFQPKMPVSLANSSFTNNSAKYNGGGLQVNPVYEGEALRIDRVRMSGNITEQKGTAIGLTKQGGDPSSAILTNLIFDGNGGKYSNNSVYDIYIYNVSVFSVTMKHITAANNPAENFLMADVDNDAGDTLTVDLYNTLLQSFTNAYAAREPGSGEVEIRHANTLMEDVTNLHKTIQGTPTFTAIKTMTGTVGLDPSLHLLPWSDAIDAGVDAGVPHDFDGDARSDGKPDIGADEYHPRLYLPVILRAVGG